jgi:hypothetical protein
MDIRYFSKGTSNFNSFQLSFNSPYFSLIAEPYFMLSKIGKVNDIQREDAFNVLNDHQLTNQNLKTSGFRNLLAFIHYKGLGFGWHNGNRWWGPGMHSSLQMSNNTHPISSQIIGTVKEIMIGRFGFYGLYSFARMNEESGIYAKYYTSINGQVTWYGPLVLSVGFSRNYLTGGVTSAGYEWKESDAKKIVFEGIFTSNLIGNEYTVGGHDVWDQTASGYLSLTFPKRRIKLYAEIGFNDNRMYFADFLSQPDHSMATIFGVRDYGLGLYKNLAWGFEWTNLMITYTSRHRGSGGDGVWYSRELYDFSSYKGRRWGAHSGADSDDWYLYIGYLSDKIMVIPALNYERHGIVSFRPAEVKMEFRLDLRYKYNEIWLGVYFEKQFEAFLGFPDYFYIDKNGDPFDSSEGELANTRSTNTIIFSLSKIINY